MKKIPNEDRVRSDTVSLLRGEKPKFRTTAMTLKKQVRYNRLRHLETYEQLCAVYHIA